MQLDENVYLYLYNEYRKSICDKIYVKYKHGTSIAQYEVLILSFINGSMLYLIGVYVGNYTLLSTSTKKAINCVRIWFYYTCLLWNVPLEGNLINDNDRKLHTGFTIVTRFFENGRKRQSLNK